MAPSHQLRSVLACLEQENFTIPSFFDSLLSEGRQHGSGPCFLSSVDVRSILTGLSLQYSELVFEWAFQLVTKKIQSEVAHLSQCSQGLHFNAKNADPSYVEGSFMQEIAEKMQPSIVRCSDNCCVAFLHM